MIKTALLDREKDTASKKEWAHPDSKITYFSPAGSFLGSKPEIDDYIEEFNRLNGRVDD